MNFLEAVQKAKTEKQYIRRSAWSEGIAMFIASPKDRHDKGFKYSGESCGLEYVATCHVAACELPGVRTVRDILADDWELMYK